MDYFNYTSPCTLLTSLLIRVEFYIFACKIEYNDES